MAAQFHRVVEASDIEERDLKAFLVNGWPVALSREGGTLHAVINRCTHAAAAFAPGGRVRRGAIMCPLHGARFKLADGSCLGGVDYEPLMIFAVRESGDGWIEVAVPEEAPGSEHMPVQGLT